MSTRAPTIGHALRGLLVWALTMLLTVCSLFLLLHLLVVAGIDPNTGVNPRVQPVAAVAMAVIVLIVVLAVFYLAMVASLLVLRPFVSREELRAHFVEQLGPGKVLWPFHEWLFERIVGRQ
jgi:hypothetical protein